MGSPVGYTYHYDQLNRMKKMRQYTGISGTSWSRANITLNYQENVTYDGNGNILTYGRNGAAPTAQTIDSLIYRYNTNPNGTLNNNRIRRITDAIANSNYTGDITNQTVSSNYHFDAIGNLIYDFQSGITGNDGVNSITWSVYGKIQSIYKTTGTISYTYNPAGERVSKTANGLTTYYIRDAQGNTLAIYDNAHSNLNWKEQQLYGSSRLGLWTPNVNLTTNNATAVWDTVGDKQYELTNHLGNVLETITDNRLQHSTSGTSIDYYNADVATAQDYYPFGMLMPGRQYSFTKVYRYGFNGKENDNDVKGVGNQQDYGMRIYDPRVGKFLSVDPIAKSYPMLTPYQFASNRPIDGVDRDGEEWQQIIPQSVWGASGIYQPNSEDQAREWMWKFMGMYTGSLAKVMGLAVGGPEEEAAVIGAEQSIENTPKTIEAISEVKVFRSTAEYAAKAMKPAEVATEAKKVKSIANLGGLYEKAANEIHNYMISKSIGVFGQAKGTLFEIKAAETLQGVYKVNETVKVQMADGTFVSQQIDILREVDGKSYLVQVKSGNFNMSYSSFFKQVGAQLQRTILTAGYTGRDAEFVFKEGSVSKDIVQNLQSAGVKVTTIK